MTERYGLLPEALQGAPKEFDEWSRLQLLGDQNATTPNFPLFHYTDEAGIRGILSSSKLWCFSHLHQTDRAEFAYSLDIAREVIQELSRSDDRVTHFFALCLLDLLNNNSFTETFEFYLFSLSQHRDDPHQWDEFGRSGSGFCLGLSPRLFQPDENELKPLANENLFVGKVIYGEEAIRSRHNHVFAKAAEITSRFANNNRELVQQVKPSTYLSAMAKEVIASQLVWNCLTGKKLKYQDEREIRFLIMNLLDRFDGLRKSYDEKAYIEALVPLRVPGNVTEIIIGANAPENAEAQINAFLSEQGYSGIPVSRSRVRAA